MLTRWIIAIVGIIGLAAVAANFYMPWHKDNVPMAVVTHPTDDEPGTFGKAAEEPMLACPADAKPANLNFTMKDAQGTNVTLSSYKGKVLLVDFWATWCGPCKVEIPWFVEFQNAYGAQGFQVIGISIDDTPDLLKPFIEQMKMNYPVLQGLGRDDVQEAFGPLVGVPTTLMIDREGMICSRHAGIASKNVFESEIKALL